MNKLLISILSIGIFINLLINVSAANITMANITLHPPQYYNLNYTSLNDTYYYPIYCLDNRTINQSNPRCDITRSLSNGETLRRDDALCKLDVSCSNCEVCQDLENVSYRIRWRVESKGKDVSVTYLNENDTRTYPIGTNFSFEDEYQVACPAVEETQQYNEEIFQGINMSNDEWWKYCAGPFAQYVTNTGKLTTSFTEFQQKLITDYASCTKSNEILAGENGKLNEIQNQFTDCQNEYEQQSREYKQCIDDLQTCQAPNGLKNFFFWFLMILNGGIVFVFGVMYLLQKMSGLPLFWGGERR